MISSIDNKYIRIGRGGGLYSQDFNEWYYRSIIKDLDVVAIVLVTSYGEMNFEYNKSCLYIFSFCLLNVDTLALL